MRQIPCGIKRQVRACAIHAISGLDFNKNIVAQRFSQIADEFLTFRPGDEEYGIEVLKVQGIRGYSSITQIANAPEFVMVN